MKTFFSLLAAVTAIGFSGEAHAVEKSSPFVKAVSFDGRMLEVRYLTGGGCQDHRGDVELTVDESVTPATITVEVVDITDKPDYCEAALFLTAKVDLSEKIADYESKTGHQLMMPKLILPVVDYQPPSAPGLPSL